MLATCTKLIITTRSSSHQLLKRSQRFQQKSQTQFLNQKQRQFSFFNNNNRLKNEQQKLDHKVDGKFLLNENKSWLSSMVNLFTGFFRYTFFNPLYSSIKQLFGGSSSKPLPWYSKMFGSSQQDKSFFSSFRIFKNTKDALIQRIVTVFGGLFFIYILAKAIPSSIRSYKLRKQELQIEASRLEIEKLRLEVEAKKLARRKEDPSYRD